jgi:hypothetical protein
MLVKLHSHAAATPKARVAKQDSGEPARVLAERHATTEQTVWKWRKHDSVEVRSHRPHRPLTTLVPVQEAVVVAMRNALVLYQRPLPATHLGFPFSVKPDTMRVMQWGSDMARIRITRSELSSTELRLAASKAKDAQAARQMLALALVLEGVDRETAGYACGLDR